MSSKDKNHDEPNIQGLSSLLSTVLAQFNTVQNADNITDQKASNLMAASFVVMVLLFGYMRSSDGALRILPITSIVALLIAVILIIHLTWQREYSGAVADLKENEDYYGKDNESLLVQLIVDAENAINKNNERLQQKQNKFRVATIIFIIGLLLGVLSLFIDVRPILI